MQPIRHLLTSAVALLALLTTAATIIGLLPLDWWLAELLRHPRPHYLVMLLGCLPVLVNRFRRGGWLLLLPIAANALVLTPLIIPPVPTIPGGQQFTIVHYNLDRHAPDHSAAFADLRAADADLIALQEFTPPLAARLSAELPGYRVVIARPLSTSHGSALLVRAATGLRVRGTGFIAIPEYSVRPLLTAEIELGDRTIAFMSLHVIRPIGTEQFAFQRIELAGAGEWARAQQTAGREVLILGDLNTTPWSRAFALLSAPAALTDSTRGHGYQPTWPATLPAPLGIPIDHGLHSAGLTTIARQTGPFHTGDHAPLLMTIAQAADR
jgi:endonuclease/exonuclease/phosphatase (EEP) superfamily protein YafD